jgi:hypothetical protein
MTCGTFSPQFQSLKVQVRRLDRVALTINQFRGDSYARSLRERSAGAEQEDGEGPEEGFHYRRKVSHLSDV